MRSHKMSQIAILAKVASRPLAHSLSPTLLTNSHLLRGCQSELLMAHPSHLPKALLRQVERLLLLQDQDLHTPGEAYHWKIITRTRVKDDPTPAITTCPTTQAIQLAS